MARRETDWQVGPVLKDKPGSQGTLFRGGTKYSSDERFARGYTPERAAAVREGIKMAEHGVKDDPVGARVTHARLTDTIARSTAPVEHLSGVQWAHVRPGEHLTSGDTAGGLYMSPRGHSTEGLAAAKPELNRSNVVLHELGHHVSHVMGNEHAKEGNYSYSSAHGGQEEAFADNYAEEHFRDRRGNKVDRGTYGGGKYAGHIERSDEFWSGYHGHRDNSMYTQHVDKKNEEYYQHFPEERVHPDNTVDEPLIHKDVEYDHEEIRKRTATARLNWDALP